MEEIKDDFDIGKTDEEAMKKNLAEQGVKAVALDTTGNVDAPTPAQPARGGRRGGRTDLHDNRARMTHSSITF